MILLENIHKSFGALVVLKGISGRIPRGEVLAIVGPSGSGKSTLLRSINLLETPTSGKVFVDNVCINDKGVDIRKLRTKVGMVFQQFNLFPHMTTLENVIYAPLRVKKIKRKDAETLGKKLLEKVGLKDKAKTYPAHLSGGQKQRAAIARALAMEPEVILFDEPFSHLDYPGIQEVLRYMIQLHQEGHTLIVTTHDVEKVICHVDRIAILQNGEIKASGSPESLVKELSRFGVRPPCYVLLGGEKISWLE